MSGPFAKARNQGEGELFWRPYLNRLIPGMATQLIAVDAMDLILEELSSNSRHGTLAKFFLFAYFRISRSTRLFVVEGRFVDEGTGRMYPIPIHVDVGWDGFPSLFTQRCWHHQSCHCQRIWPPASRATTT